MLNLPLVLALVAAAPQPSHVERDLDARVTHVDLDLSRAPGRRTLDRRIASAVEKVCPVPHSFQLTVPTGTLRCRAKARNAAVLQRSVVMARIAAPLQLSASSH